jgi:hypothetical protein
MHVDAVLVLGRLIFEIVGEAEHRREFLTGHRIEVGVAAAGVDRSVPDAEVGKARRVVCPDRYISGDVPRCRAFHVSPPAFWLALATEQGAAALGDRV